jgi:hypothetical protein
MVWPGPISFAMPDRAGDVDAGRAAHHHAFLLRQGEDDLQRLVVVNPIGEIGREAFQIGGDAALADPLGDRGAFRLELAGRVEGIERGAHRIGDADLDVGLVVACSPSATPASVPPEPTAQMKPSTLPPVSRQISGAVVSTCACRLTTLSNWLAQIAPFGSLFAICSARRPDTRT